MLRVHEIMNTEVATCRADTTLDHVASLMWRHDCGAIPVVDGADEPIAMITDRDIAIGGMLNRRSQRDLRVDDITQPGEIFLCGAADDIQDALMEMRRHRARRLPVVDETGRLAGIHHRTHGEKAALWCVLPGHDQGIEANLTVTARVANSAVAAIQLRARLRSPPRQQFARCYIAMSSTPARCSAFSAISVIVASVRSRTLATDTAFSSATRITFVGSTMPAS